MNRIRAIAEHRQSIWYDYIQRSMIWTGHLYRMVQEDGLRGITSNPAIFEKAIGKSKDYEAALKSLVDQGLSSLDSFEQLAIADIQLACDVLRSVYDQTKGLDGYVSLEVSPHLAYDTVATVEEGLRLWQAVARDNLMIKVPATEEGLPAIEQLIAEGVNVNVTLLFAVDRYEAVHQRYISGLETLVRRGGDPAKVASVASFFVSRIDSLVDQQIDARKDPTLSTLKGKVAIANAKLAYQSYLATVSEPRWQALAQKGAQPQRLLWASTGTKNPAYRDVLYVEALIGPDTVNTVPEATYEAFKDHGNAASTLTENVADAQAVMARLAQGDISIQAITDTLLEQGVQLFMDAFDRLMGTVERRRQEFLGDRLGQMRANLGSYEAQVAQRLTSLAASNFVRRLWDRDASLFVADEAQAESASGFMGWLTIADHMEENLEHLLDLQDELEQDGTETVVLMGMGGSSLAPDVFARTFGQLDGSPELLVLDSTVPAQVKAIEDAVNPHATVFVVASKSGTTSEPLAFDAYFFDKVQDGERFIAITDPDSKLEQMAIEREFRNIYNGDPEVGGRYSALSPFGLVPAAAMGLDVGDLLERTQLMVASCNASVPVAENPGVQLGAILGQLALAGRDKLTLVAAPGVASFGIWVEQLVAESTGKHGKGIVPVDGEVLGEPSVYGDDRVFVYLNVVGEDLEAHAATESKLEALQAAGHPVLRFSIADRRDIVQEMFRWEIATATAGHVLGINPFDQPNVQESKTYTAQLLGQYASSGKLPPIPGETLIWSGEGISVYADAANAAALGKPGSLTALLKAHVNRAQAGDYVAFNAYLPMSTENEAVLQRLRQRVRDGHRVATTVGFGPRFLHSTGQLHKGGANTGIFLQLTADDATDIEVPGQGYSFGVLKRAQEAGDFMALSKRERRLIRIHLGADTKSALDQLLVALDA